MLLKRKDQNRHYRARYSASGTLMTNEYVRHDVNNRLTKSAPKSDFRFGASPPFCNDRTYINTESKCSYLQFGRTATATPTRSTALASGRSELQESSTFTIYFAPPPVPFPVSQDQHFVFHQNSHFRHFRSNEKT